MGLKALTRRVKESDRVENARQSWQTDGEIDRDGGGERVSLIK